MIRFNIRFAEPRDEDGDDEDEHRLHRGHHQSSEPHWTGVERKVARPLEQLSHVVLAGAYVVSVTYYLQLLSAFVLDRFGVHDLDLEPDRDHQRAGGPDRGGDGLGPAGPREDGDLRGQPQPGDDRGAAGRSGDPRRRARRCAASWRRRQLVARCRPLPCDAGDHGPAHRRAGVRDLAFPRAPSIRPRSASRTMRIAQLLASGIYLVFVTLMLPLFDGGALRRRSPRSSGWSRRSRRCSRPSSWSPRSAASSRPRSPTTPAAPA